MRSAGHCLLAFLLWGVLFPAEATDSIQVGRWSTDKEGYVYRDTTIEAKKNKQTTTVTFANNLWGIVLPNNARSLAVDHVDCWGDASELGDPADDCMGWVSTRGELRIRATVRYGWFAGFETEADGKPFLEIFVHKDSKTSLPRITGWVPGDIHEFMISNEALLLRQLFSPQQLQQVRRKKTLFVEVDSDLLLSHVNFGNECGIRYQAKVVSAKHWVDAQVVAKSKGWEAHC